MTLDLDTYTSMTSDLATHTTSSLATYNIVIHVLSIIVMSVRRNHLYLLYYNLYIVYICLYCVEIIMVTQLFMNVVSVRLY